MNEIEAKTRLSATVSTSRGVIQRVTDAFHADWNLNPGQATRAALGKWIVTATRHLTAMNLLAEEHDLWTVSHSHHRQIFEILLQVRHFTQAEPALRDRLAQRVSASGCLELLDHLEPLQDHPKVRPGYQEMTDLLSKYDQDVIEELRAQRAKRRFNWFGTSFTELARRVSIGHEDLAGAYGIISSEHHGVWDLTIGVAAPDPGVLDFRGYPDLEANYQRAADLVDEATQRYAQIWNDVARIVGAPTVDIEFESN
jgi:hypothetical protein